MFPDIPDKCVYIKFLFPIQSWLICLLFCTSYVDLAILSQSSRLFFWHIIRYTKSFTRLCDVTSKQYTVHLQSESQFIYMNKISVYWLCLYVYISLHMKVNTITIICFPLLRKKEENGRPEKPVYLQGFICLLCSIVKLKKSDLTGDVLGILLYGIPLEMIIETTCKLPTNLCTLTHKQTQIQCCNISHTTSCRRRSYIMLYHDTTG